MKANFRVGNVLCHSVCRLWDRQTRSITNHFHIWSVERFLFEAEQRLTDTISRTIGEIGHIEQNVLFLEKHHQPYRTRVSDHQALPIGQQEATHVTGEGSLLARHYITWLRGALYWRVPRPRDMLACVTPSHTPSLSHTLSLSLLC